MVIVRPFLSIITPSTIMIHIALASISIARTSTMGVFFEGKAKFYRRGGYLLIKRDNFLVSKHTMTTTSHMLMTGENQGNIVYV
jgi:hypothetical protein